MNTISSLLNYLLDKANGLHVALTQSAYDQLSQAEKENGKVYLITDGTPTGMTASNVTATSAGGSASNVQAELNSLNSNTTNEKLSTDAVSGAIYIVRSGKVRQLTFDDAKAPSAGYFNIPQLQEGDRPNLITQALLRRLSDGGTVLIWVRTNGTFGWAGTLSGDTYNGTLTWVVT